MAIKYGYHLFEYFPVLDDWIQYGNYPLYDNIFSDVIVNIATYTTRPLAALSDPYIWGQFWPNMRIAFIIITLLHTLSAYFLYQVIKHYKLAVGLPFLIIYGLFPLGTEASYWISASSRIIVGIFFMALALFLLLQYFKTKKKPYFIAFACFHLVSLAYYEQVTILSVFIASLILIAEYKKIKFKGLILIPLINFMILLTYYMIFSQVGNLATRGNLISGDYLQHFKNVLDQVFYIFYSVSNNLLINGFSRGLKLLWSEASYIYILLILMIGISSAIMTFKKEKEPLTFKRNLVTFLLGLILFFVPLSLNFVLESIWISLRNVFMSFIGLGLMVESLWQLLYLHPLLKYLRSFLVGLVVCVFLIVNVSEIDDYKKASQVDREVAWHVLDHLEASKAATGDRSVMIFGGESTYIDQNSYYNDHIHNVTTSDWALTGAVRSLSKNLNYKHFIMHPWAGGAFKIPEGSFETAIILGIGLDRKVYPLSFRVLDHIYIDLYTKDMKLFGVLEWLPEYEKYYFHIK
jgi:hypothetical protein